MEYAKALREQLGRVSVEVQSLIDTAKKENNRGFTPEERERFNKLIDDHTKLEGDIKLAEKGAAITAAAAAPSNGDGVQPSLIGGMTVEQVQDEFRLKPAQVRAREELFKKDPHARAFNSYIRRPSALQYLTGVPKEDLEILNKLQVRNAQSTTTAQGGYLIPQGFSGQLEEAKKWFGGIPGVVGKFETASGNPWPWPTINDTTNKGRILGQNVQVVETDFVFGQVTFQAYIGTSDVILIPDALLQDSYFDMDGLTARLLGIRLGRLYNNKCTVGSGTGEPTGLITAATTSGNITTLTTGNTASIAYNNLVDVEHSVDPAYRYNPGTHWMFADGMLKLIKKLTDTQNRPLWQPGISASFREGAAVDLVASKPLILDHPYVINQDMATPAASQYTIAFGDMNTFKVREVAGGTTVLRLVERYADYLQVGFIAFQRFDSNLIDAGTRPVALMQQSAT